MAIPVIPRDNGDDVEPELNFNPNQPSDPGPTPSEANAFLVCASWKDISRPAQISHGRENLSTGLPYYFATDQLLSTPLSTTQDEIERSAPWFVRKIQFYRIILRKALNTHALISCMLTIR